jgi:hypothetical protein
MLARALLRSFVQGRESPYQPATPSTCCHPGHSSIPSDLIRTSSPFKKPQKNTWIFLALLSSAFATHFFLFGQTREMRFQRIALDPGMVDYRTFDIAQDSIGFLWFATSEGLYKYDGFSYKIYRPLLNDTSGISSNTIWCLLTDRSGKLWIGTFDGGLDCFEHKCRTYHGDLRRPPRHPLDWN